jgi:hypothetical protein
MADLFPDPIEKLEETESKPKSKRGGFRPGSGRKPKAITVYRDAFVADKADCAEYAFKLYNETMRDESAPRDLRLGAGKEVMDRVWGRAKQAVEHSGVDGRDLTIHVHYAELDPAAAALGPEDNPQGDEEI